MAVAQDVVRELDKHLHGKKVAVVRRMTKQEADQFGWYTRPVVIVMEDGTFLIPQSDDEGNAAGALLAIHDDKELLVYVEH